MREEEREVIAAGRARNMAFGTVQFAEVVVVAASRDQAAILLRQVVGFVRRSPALSVVCDPTSARSGTARRTAGSGSWRADSDRLTASCRRSRLSTSFIATAPPTCTASSATASARAPASSVISHRGR